MQSFWNSVGVVVIGSALSFLIAWFWHKKNAAALRRSFMRGMESVFSTN